MYKSAPRRRGQNLRRRWDDVLERKATGYRFYKQIKGVHKFQRAFRKVQWTLSAGVQTFYGYSFKLSDVPDVSELSNLFDYYRITGVQITIIPHENVADYGGTNGIATLFTVPDHNDATTPASTSAMLQYPKCRISMLNKPVKFFIKPRTAVLDASNGNSMQQLKFGQWVAMDSSGVDHYGVKFGVQTPSASNFDVYFKYYIECKNPR